MLGGGWLLFGRGGDDSGSSESVATRDRPANDRGAGSSNGREAKLPASSCPAGLANCEVASGRVIYVESVDPDGDGDAHFVTLSNESITSTGITVFDVKPELRPDPLPGRGDLVGGYGPVHQGSYGQSQIEVVEFHVAR